MTLNSSFTEEWTEERERKERQQILRETKEKEKKIRGMKKKKKKKARSRLYEKKRKKYMQKVLHPVGGRL